MFGSLLCCYRHARVPRRLVNLSAGNIRSSCMAFRLGHWNRHLHIAPSQTCHNSAQHSHSRCPHIQLGKEIDPSLGLIPNYDLSRQRLSVKLSCLLFSYDCPSLLSLTSLANPAKNTVVDPASANFLPVCLISYSVELTNIVLEQSTLTRLGQNVISSLSGLRP